MPATTSQACTSRWLEKRYAGGGRGCCTLEDVHDARRAADMLGIAFYVWDFAQRFQETVLDDFLQEYREGRTPNPCVNCNQHIKFAAVLERAQALGFDAVGTGHYARLVDGPDGVELHARSTPRRTSRTSSVSSTPGSWRLRCSHWATAQVRSPRRPQPGSAGGGQTGQPRHLLHPRRGHLAFLRDRLGGDSGPIVDEASGARVGTPPRAVGFTIGQRRGLNLRQPAPDGKPRYIVDVDMSSNTVFVGPPARLRVHGFTVDRLRWTGPSDLLAP